MSQFHYAAPHPAAGRKLTPVALWLAAVHGAGLLALVVYVTACTPVVATLVFIGCWFCLGQLATRLCAHSSLAHKALEFHPAVETGLLIIQAGNIQGPAKWWGFWHRIHHAYSDTAMDPYSAKHGFWWAHLWWMCYEMPELPLKILVHHSKDFKKNPRVMWQSKYYFHIAAASALLPAFIPMLWGDHWGGLVLSPVRLVFQYHCTWIVNSVAHRFGFERPYESLGARILWNIARVPLALVSAGELWDHPRHHKYPHDFRIGVGVFACDPGKWAAICLKRLHLVGRMQVA